MDAATGDRPDDEYLELGRLISQFYRRGHLLYQRIDFDPPLERAAYTLLARIVADGPTRLSTLAGTLVLDLSTVSRQVAALEAAGLVERTADPADRRVSVIAVTETGRAAYVRNRGRWVAVLRELLADWTPEERRDFTRLFNRLNDSIAPPGGGPDPGSREPGRDEERHDDHR